MKYIVLLFALLSISFTAHAQKKASAKKSFSRPYGMAGCGLGSAALGKRGNQVLAGTTNGTSYNQLFGITSGTLNCVDGSEAEVAHKADFYIQANRFALQGDVARGQGDTLAGLSTVLGCKTGSKLGGALKNNYGGVFTPGSTPNEITDAIITVIINDEALASECTLG